MKRLKFREIKSFAWFFLNLQITIFLTIPNAVSEIQVFWKVTHLHHEPAAICWWSPKSKTFFKEQKERQKICLSQKRVWASKAQPYPPGSEEGLISTPSRLYPHYTHFKQTGFQHLSILCGIPIESSSLRLILCLFAIWTWNSVSIMYKSNLSRWVIFQFI